MALLPTTLWICTKAEKNGALHRFILMWVKYMKYAVLSFDDGRADTYENAYKILKKHGLTATINAVTDFIARPERYSDFASGGNKAMTAEQLAECQKNGIEIACHGATHQNTADDILRNIRDLQNMGISTDGIGFASPNSHVTETTCGDVWALADKKIISYIRSGVRLERESFLYKTLTAAERITHSKYLFYILNKRNIESGKNNGILKSVAVLKCTTPEQLIYFMEKMKDNDAVIFMLHSVIDKNCPYYAADKWCWDTARFIKLCAYLKETDGIQTVTTKDLLN